jgi:hypothetical protein
MPTQNTFGSPLINKGNAAPSIYGNFSSGYPYGSPIATGGNFDQFGNLDYTNPFGDVPSATQAQAKMAAEDGGGGGMPMSAASMALGGLQIAGGLYGLSRLGKRPTYQISDDITAAKDRSARFAEMGYTPEQKAQFQQQMSRTTNTMEANAREMAGGSLGRAISGMKSYQQLGALNTFAANDAARMMENIRYDDKMAMYIQNEKNRATADSIRNYEMLASLYGGAVSKGFENMIGGVNYNEALKMYAKFKGAA